MATGSIPPPQIVPLRVQQAFSHAIDTNTLIEIRSERNGVDIYYTLDGAKPDSFITLTKGRSTLEYTKPFYIPWETTHAGTATVKAIVVSRDGLRESTVMAKTFNVQRVPSDHAQSDEYENRYIHELQQERQELTRRIQSENELAQRRSLESMVRPAVQTPPSHRPLRYSALDQPRQPAASPSWHTCSNCTTTIPHGSDACVVCENLIASRTASPTQTQIVCPQCKVPNPMHFRTCSVCQSALLPSHPSKLQISLSAGSPTGAMITCPKCSRLNPPNARFCDRCSLELRRVSLSIACARCQADNHSSARFCLACGCPMEPPLRLIDPRARNDFPPAAAAAATRKYQRAAATQTRANVHPSATEVSKLIEENKQLLAERELRENRPKLSSVSPGKGYWHQQIDHICAHLKAYATNRADYRAVIGEPRMGKMVHSTVHEDEHQFVVQLVFNKPEDLSRSMPPTREVRERYSVNSERSSTGSISSQSDDEYVAVKPERKKTKKRSPAVSATSNDQYPNLSLIAVLEQMRDDGRQRKSFNREDEVRRLLKKDADANYRNKEGYTCLQLAVRNLHHECLETLIEVGRAKLDAKGGPLGNTALHECCLLGTDGIEPLRILLKHGGDPMWTNNKNVNVSDYAAKRKCQPLVDLIAEHRGQQMVQQQTKHYYQIHA